MDQVQDTILYSFLSGGRLLFRFSNFSDLIITTDPFQVFLRHLPSLHTSPHLADTVIVTRSGAQLPCHSLVLAAASSMMKHVFEEVQDKLMDTQFTILMPDHTIEEAADCLKSIYGTEAVTLSNPLAIDFNIGDINSNGPKAAASEKVTSNHQLVHQEERPEVTSLNSYVGHSILDEEPPEPRNTLKRKRGRPKKTKHGYLNDDFIDDNEDGDWNVGQHLFEDKEEKPKKKRGRPKKVKEEDDLEKLEELEHYDELEEMEETILEPVVKVKEEEIERSFHEFNEFFSATPAANTVETQISFNQDDTGLFQCEAPGMLKLDQTFSSNSKHFKVVIFQHWFVPVFSSMSGRPTLVWAINLQPKGKEG